MKTHINQILTVVSFFSLSLTTTLAISWGMYGLMSDEKTVKAQCSVQSSAVIRVMQSKACINDSMKILIPKNNFKSNG